MNMNRKILCGIVMAAAVLGIRSDAAAVVVDLNGGVTNFSSQASFSLAAGDEFRNGTINLAAELNGGLAQGVYTIGQGAILKPAQKWVLSNANTIKVINGGIVEFNGGLSVCFGYRQGNNTLFLDGGTFNVSNELQVPYAWPATAADTQMPNEVRICAVNESAIDVGNQIVVGHMAGSAVSGASFIRSVFAVTNSSVTVANGFMFASPNDRGTLEYDFRGEFGEGARIKCKQIYVRQYMGDGVQITFDGATLSPNDSVTLPFIGQNLADTTPFNVIGKGLTLDFDIDYTEKSGYFSSLQGSGSVYKTGCGKIELSRCRYNNTQAFTGALVVSNGAWVSSLNYAAEAFRADGGRLTLTGKLLADEVALAATKGGELLLAGAEMADKTPGVVLASCGTTDYFTRDGMRADYSLDSLELGPGAVLDLDGDSVGCDTILAEKTAITATAEDPVVINIGFSSVPCNGTVLKFFEADDAAKFCVRAVNKSTGLSVPVETEILEGVFAATIATEDLVWNGTKESWNEEGAWTFKGEHSSWEDDFNAVFADDGGSCVLDSDVTTKELRFGKSATVSGNAELSVSYVVVSEGAVGTINVPVSSNFEKRGEGVLILGEAPKGTVAVREGTIAFPAKADGYLKDCKFVFSPGSVLEIPFADMEIGSLSFQGEGSMLLKIIGDTILSAGKYEILSCAEPFQDDILAKLLLDASSVKGANYAWLELSGDGKALVLHISETERSQNDPGVWIGGSGSFSVAENWLDGKLPKAEHVLDFSGVTSNITVDFGDMADVFEGVKLGTAKRQITVKGLFCIKSLEVTLQDVNLSVASGSRLVVDGDVTLNNESKVFLFVVGRNEGTVEVRGKVLTQGKALGYPCYECIEGAVFVVGGIVNCSSGDRFKLNARKSYEPQLRWIVGVEGCFPEDGRNGFWLDVSDANGGGRGAVLQPADSGFTIGGDDFGVRNVLTFDTTDTNNVGGTITINATVFRESGSIEVLGKGRVVCNYDAMSKSSYRFTGKITLKDTATLALGDGKCATTGKIVVNEGAALEVSESGNVQLEGDLELMDGACLGFNFTTRDVPPVLSFASGKVVSFSEKDKDRIVKVKVSAENGTRPRAGKYFLTEGGQFGGADVSLASDSPSWASLSVKDGDIYLTVKPSGFLLIVN